MQRSLFRLRRKPTFPATKITFPVSGPAVSGADNLREGGYSCVWGYKMHAAVIYCDRVVRWDSAGLGCQDRGDKNASRFINRSVHKITAKDKWEAKLSEAEKEGKIVVAAFTASWCAPCKEIIPFYQELAGKYENVSFITIDVDELAEFSSSWDIKATPTFFFLKDGRQVDKHVGADKLKLEKKVATISASLKASQQS